MKKLAIIVALAAFGTLMTFPAHAQTNVFEMGESTSTALVVVSTISAILVDIEIDTGPLQSRICCYNAPETTGLVAATCQRGSTIDRAGTASAVALDSSKIAQITITGGLDSMKLVTPIQRPRRASRGLVCGKSAATIDGRVIWQQY